MIFAMDLERELDVLLVKWEIDIHYKVGLAFGLKFSTSLTQEPQQGKKMGRKDWILGWKGFSSSDLGLNALQSITAALSLADWSKILHRSKIKKDTFPTQFPKAKAK